MIHTAGGSFDPDDRPLFFLAATPRLAVPRNYLMAANDLFTDQGVDILTTHLDNGVRVLLDSGVFNLAAGYRRTHGVSLIDALQVAPEDMDGFDKLYDRYIHLCRSYGDRLWGYIELDLGGQDSKRRIRARLHDEGLAPIPVYHALSDDWDYFDELAESHDRVCVGNLAQADMNTRVRLLHTLWERHRRYPRVWLHMLGLTVNEWCLPCPPDSCDSSAAVDGLRYAHVDLGYTMLRRAGSIWSSEWRYDQHADEETRSEQIARAMQLYTDEVESQNMIWRQIRADVDNTFGPVDAYPPLTDAEAMPV